MSILIVGNNFTRSRCSPSVMKMMEEIHHHHEEEQTTLLLVVPQVVFIKTFGVWRDVSVSKSIGYASRRTGVQIFQHPSKSWVWLHVPVTLAVECGDRLIPGICCSASLAKMTKFRFSERLHHKA